MTPLTSRYWFIACIVFILRTSTIETKSFAMTRFVCEVLDDEFCIFKICSLKNSPGGIMLMNAHMQPLQIFENITVKINFFRQEQKAYRQFYYETLLDFCGFLKNYKRQIPWGLMYQSVVKYSNINHSCPYHHDLIVDNLRLVGTTFELIPLPKGHYLLQLMVLWNKVQKIKVQVYIVRK